MEEQMRKLFGVLMLGAAMTGCSEPTGPRPTESALAPSFDRGHGEVTPGVAPRQSRPRGRSYEEWGGALLQWVASIPAGRNPFEDATGAFTMAAESGKVWFLMGPSEMVPQPQTATIRMPPGTALFFSPLGLYLAGPGGIAGDGDDTPAELLAIALSDNITGVQVEIDGRRVADIGQYHLISPTVGLHTPVNNIYTVDFGEPNPFTFGIFEGYGLFIEPLPPGKHVIHAVSAVPDFGLWFDITYIIVVGH
jgi:hypothetical protein